MTQVTLQCAPFAAAWKLVNGAVPGRTPKPVLRNVRLDVGPEGSVLSATDLEIGMRVAVPGMCGEPCSVLLNPTRFGQILAECREESLELDVSKGSLGVKAGRSKFKLQTESADEFPVVAPIGNAVVLSVAGDALRTMLKRTRFCTDVESGRYALSGVLFDYEPGRLNLVATDGRRLAAASIGAECDKEFPKSVLPSHALRLLEHSLPGGPVQVGWDTNRAWAHWEHVDWTCRVVEGRFPTWRDVLPHEDHPLRLSLPAGVLLSAWRQAQITTDKESLGIDLGFHNGTLTLSATTSQVGESSIEVPIAYEGVAVKVTLSGDFVAEFLAVLDASQLVEIQAKDDDSSVLFSLADGHRYVVMPLSRG